jgi:SAM-dependent methyltransferase
LSAFEASWLEARERADHVARSQALARAFAAAVGAAPRIVDLGAGSGSNLRYLAPLLRSPQSWALVDNDPSLLGQAATRLERWAGEIGLEVGRAGGNLRLAGVGREIEVAFDERDLADMGDDDRTPMAGSRESGITASALLDLASAAWLDCLAAWAAKRPAPLLFALSFDGRLLFEPGMEEDETVRRSVLRHQRTDKGLGPALGPDAVRHLAERLDAAGRRVELAATDWCLDAGTRNLARMFLDGVFRILHDLEVAEDLRSWSRERRQQLADGRLRIRVGHQDLFAR